MIPSSLPSNGVSDLFCQTIPPHKNNKIFPSYLMHTSITRSHDSTKCVSCSTSDTHYKHNIIFTLQKYPCSDVGFIFLGYARCSKFKSIFRPRWWYRVTMKMLGHRKIWRSSHNAFLQSCVLRFYSARAQPDFSKWGAARGAGRTDRDSKWRHSVDPCTKWHFIRGSSRGGGLDFWLGGAQAYSGENSNYYTAQQALQNKAYKIRCCVTDLPSALIITKKIIIMNK